MNQYVVCMDSYYVRDAQMGLSDGEMSNADIHSEAMEEHWHDMEPTVNIDAKIKDIMVDIDAFFESLPVYRTIISQITEYKNVKLPKIILPNCRIVLTSR